MLGNCFAGDLSRCDNPVTSQLFGDLSRRQNMHFNQVVLNAIDALAFFTLPRQIFEMLVVFNVISLKPSDEVPIFLFRRLGQILQNIRLFFVFSNYDLFQIGIAELFDAFDILYGIHGTANDDFPMTTSQKI
jgi:hypothetical protein